MRSQDFNKFYEVVIEQCINDLKEDVCGNAVLEGYFRDTKKDAKRRIFQNYQKKRDFIKNKYMSKKAPVALDRHKVASCMVYAILKANPIKVNMWVSGLPEKIVMANEYLAFFVALNIIEMYKLDDIIDLNKKRKEEGLSEISDGYQIVMPKTYHEKDNPENTYESNLCKAWYYIKIDNIEKFDVLGYANVFFLLQKYTDTFLELKETKVKLKEIAENKK